MASLRSVGRVRRLWRGLPAVALLLPLVVVVVGGASSAPATAADQCWIGGAAVRGNVWMLAPNFGSSVATKTFRYGLAGDVPFFGHWDAASAYSAPGVVRGNKWYLRRSQTTGGGDIGFTFGKPGDIPVVGDWNGDGIDTPGMVRGRTWYLRNSNSAGPADVVFTFNEPGIPTVFGSLTYGDSAQPATFDRGTWHVRLPDGTVATAHFGRAGDIPLGGGYYVPAPDCTSPSLAFVRKNVWHISANGFHPDSVFTFGQVGDHFLAQHF